METFPKKPQYFIITLDRHAGIFVMCSQMFIPPVLPGIAWHIGFAMEDWSHNDPLGTNKWNEDVKCDGVSIASRGNSPWPVVPHWNLFPYPGIPINPNILIPLLILLSSSKSFLAVGSVVAQKGPIAVMIPGVKVVGVNMACADPIPMPAINVVWVGQSTVVLGFTLGDLLAALLQWAIDIIIALAVKVLGKIVGALGKRLANKIGQRLAGRFTSGVMNKVGNFLSNIGSNAAKNGPPGFLKRMQLNALGKLGLPKVFNQPGAPSTLLGRVDKAVFGGLDNVFSANWMNNSLSKFGLPVDRVVKPGQFVSVADTLTGALTNYGKSAATTAGKQGWSALNGPKPYSPSLPDKIGGWLDGRSELINP